MGDDNGMGPFVNSQAASNGPKWALRDGFFWENGRRKAGRERDEGEGGVARIKVLVNVPEIELVPPSPN